MAGTRRRTYLDLLDRVHRAVLPRGYVEIGVCDGSSLTLALPGTRAVGIDPEPIDRKRYPRHTRIFRMTSDDYFASRDLERDLGAPCDMAFIDGMHLFEFALRDFANIEQHAHADSVVFVHDCYPVDAVTAERHRTQQCWSGDVWKLIVCLKAERPDLQISVVDIPPTGLAIITGLDPSSTLLKDRYDDLVAQYMDLPYGVLEADKATTLARVDDDWSQVARMLPGPFRRGERRLAFRRTVRGSGRYIKDGAHRNLSRARRLVRD